MNYAHVRDNFLDMYRALDNRKPIKIRGSWVKEVRLYQIVVDPTYPVTSFVSRNFNIDYAKKEILWYIKGDRYDLSICDVAGSWFNMVQEDGGINSNYGQTIFQGPKHFDWVVEELIRDKNSRRAVIILGEPDKLKQSNTDHRCTMYICYHIRDNKLHQTVHMRSNDAVFGVTNDCFFFGFLHQFVWSELKNMYADLELGEYVHLVDSLHVYERHFEMVENIIKEEDWYELDIPRINPYGEELRCLRQDVISNRDFCIWINT
jgi:thymidylate synthase